MDPLHAPTAPPCPTPIRYIDLFAGVGGMRIPFDELGCTHVFSSEIDPAARRTYERNFGKAPHGDLTCIGADEIPPHDLLLAGFPCQAFSIMGKKLGFADTRGTLFFEVERILQHRRPAALLLENVKQLVTHDQGRTFRVILERLEALGYHVTWKVLNALDFGLPQKRERILIAGFTDPKHASMLSLVFAPQAFNLAATLESDESADPALFASKAITHKRRAGVLGKRIFSPSVWHENKSGNVSILPYACALRAGASYNYLLINGYRRPSIRELLRFQGFPEHFVIPGSYTTARRQTGNAVPVAMIRAVAERMYPLLIAPADETIPA